MAEGISVLDYEWPCPSCTYINKAGSFKCHVCGAPKGTSTRQVKFHTSALEQQYVAESFQFRPYSSRPSSKSLQSSSSHITTTASPPSGSSTTTSSYSTESSSTFSSSAGTSGSGGGATKRKMKAKISKGPHVQPKWPKLPNLDRSSRRSTEITVNSVTVIISEYDALYPDSD